MASKETEIISITPIKPSSPTPPHLRTFKLSYPDQLFPNVYATMMFFYPHDNAVPSNVATDPHHRHDHDYTDSFHSKSKLLQKALSETLTLFYPLAGRFQDDSTVICNDAGAVFTESKTNLLLSDILASHVFDLLASEFVSAKYPEVLQLSNGPLLLFNFILFPCGGTAVCVSASHKIFDMSSFMTFFKSLSAACRGSEPIAPDFHAAAAHFPPKEIPTKNAAKQFGINAPKVSKRSFVFSASKIQELKKITADSLKKEGYEFDYLSRVNVVTAFIWKCLVTSFISQKGFFRPTVMSQAANFRNRLRPPLPSHAIGNLSFTFPKNIVENESDVQLSELVKKLLELKVSMDEKAKRLNSDELVRELADESGEIFSKKDQMNLYIGTSCCRFELYEVDFGILGKPVWVTNIAPEHIRNFVVLLDTKEEGGVEALVHLDEEDMKAFECNKELVQFAVPS